MSRRLPPPLTSPLPSALPCSCSSPCWPRAVEGQSSRPRWCVEAGKSVVQAQGQGWLAGPLDQALGLQCGCVCPHVPSFLGRPTPPSKSLLLAGRSRLWPEAADPGPRKHVITEQGVGGIPGETPGSPGSPCSLGPPEPNSFSLLTSRDGGLTLCEGGPCLVG